MKYLPQEMVERVKKRGTKASQSPQEEALRFMREDTPKLLASLRELETSLRPFYKRQMSRMKISRSFHRKN